MTIPDYIAIGVLGRVGTVGGNTVYAIRVGSLHPSPRARTTKPQTRVGSRVQRRPCVGTRHAWRSLPKRERTHLSRERTQDLRIGSGSWGGPDGRRAQGRRQRRVMTRYTNLSPSEVPVDNRRGPGRGTLGASRANGSSQLTPNIRRKFAKLRCRVIQPSSSERLASFFRHRSALLERIRPPS